MVSVLARYASRFSIRALDLTVDSSMLWVGAGLAVAAAVLLAYVPRLPSPRASSGASVATGSVRITGRTNRRLRALRGHADRGLVHAPGRRRDAGQDAVRAAAAESGFDTRNVLALNVPVMCVGPDTRSDPRVLSRHAATDHDLARREPRGDWRCGAVARRWQRRAGVPVHRRRVHARRRRRGSARPAPHGVVRLLRARWACRWSPDATSTKAIGEAPNPSSSSARAWPVACFPIRKSSIAG